MTWSRTVAAEANGPKLTPIQAPGNSYWPRNTIGAASVPTAWNAPVARPPTETCAPGANRNSTPGASVRTGLVEAATEMPVVNRYGMPGFGQVSLWVMSTAYTRTKSPSFPV